MDERVDQPLDPSHYLRMLWRRKGIVILCSVTVVCTALVGLHFATREYESAATMRIVDPQPMTRDVEQLMGGMRQLAGGYGVDEQRIAEVASRIRSRPFLERVIRTIGMHENPRVRARARERLANNPEIEASEEEMSIRMVVDGLRQRVRIAGARGVYRVSVTQSTPKAAHDLATWITELFVNVSKSRSREHMEATRDFGLDQLRVYEDRLDASEERWEEGKRRLIEGDLDGGLVSGSNLELAESLLRRVTEEAEAAQAVATAGAGRNSGVSGDLESMLRDPLIGELRSSLYTARREHLAGRLAIGTAEVGRSTSGGYSIRRRDILRDIERRVDELEPSLPQDALGTRARLVFSNLNLEAQTRAARFLEDHIKAYKARVKRSPEAEIELARLEADVLKNRHLLQSFQAQLVATEINQAADNTDLGLTIEVLEEAQLPLSPSYPDTRKILLMALLMGPLVGVGLAFVAESTDRTLRTMEDFRRVAPEPILGTTPLLSRGAVQRPGRLQRHWVPIAVAAILLATAAVFLVGGQLAGASTPAGTRVSETAKESTR